MVILLFVVVTAIGQGPTIKEVDSMLKVLPSTKMEMDRIGILFKLAQFQIFKPGENQVDFDSAKVYMKEAADLNAKLRDQDVDGFLLIIESLITREKGQLTEAKVQVEKAIAILKNGKNKYYLGRAYYTLSEYYDYSKPDESSEKIRLVELACMSYQGISDINLYAYTLTFLADLYQLNNENEKAIKKLDTALALYQSTGYKELQSVYALYSTVYFGENLFRQALKYSLLALQSAHSSGDTSMTLCQINNYIGLAYLQSKEFASAIPYFMEALKIAGKYDDGNAALPLMMNTVHSYIQLKKPEQALTFMKAFPEKLRKPKSDVNYVQTPLAYLLIYTELKKYKEAQPYVGEILELIRHTNISARVLSNSYYMITKYYVESGQYQAARSYVRKLDSTRALSSTLARLISDFYLKFRLDTAQDNYKSAVANLLAYQKLNDSLFNETSKRQIKQLEIEYETEKRKNEINLLSQTNLSQQNRLDRDKLVKKFTMGGLVLFFIIIGLLYWQYRNKQHSNKVILQKNVQLEHILTEKEWLVKEIHHRVKNNFHIVASLLEIQSSYLKNKEALSAIKESQHRIHSMSIIHQKLYQSETLSTIHMPEYIYELVEYLRESYAIRENIRFSLQVENIELNHASAITLGLILNEAITNAIKYAFAKTEDGKISISLSHISESQILLSIADNGRGLPVDFDSKIGASMGMELLQGLTDDLGGSFSIETKEGTLIKVIFDYKPVIAANVSFS